MKKIKQKLIDWLAEQPMIFTTKGHVFEANLKHAVTWVDHEDYTKMIETYTDTNGEVVKQSVHVMGKKPLELFAQQPT